MQRVASDGTVRCYFAYRAFGANCEKYISEERPVLVAALAAGSYVVALLALLVSVRTLAQLQYYSELRLMTSVGEHGELRVRTTLMVIGGCVGAMLTLCIAGGSAYARGAWAHFEMLCTYAQTVLFCLVSLNGIQNKVAERKLDTTHALSRVKGRCLICCKAATMGGALCNVSATVIYGALPDTDMWNLSAVGLHLSFCIFFIAFWLPPVFGFNLRDSTRFNSFVACQTCSVQCRVNPAVYRWELAAFSFGGTALVASHAAGGYVTYK